MQDLQGSRYVITRISPLDTLSSGAKAYRQKDQIERDAFFCYLQIKQCSLISLYSDIPFCFPPRLSGHPCGWFCQSPEMLRFCVRLCPHHTPLPWYLHLSVFSRLPFYHPHYPNHRSLIVLAGLMVLYV